MTPPTLRNSDLRQIKWVTIAVQEVYIPRYVCASVCIKVSKRHFKVHWGFPTTCELTKRQIYKRCILVASRKWWTLTVRRPRVESQGTNTVPFLFRTGRPSSVRIDPRSNPCSRPVGYSLTRVSTGGLVRGVSSTPRRCDRWPEVTRGECRNRVSCGWTQNLGDGGSTSYWEVRAGREPFVPWRVVVLLLERC